MVGSNQKATVDVDFHSSGADAMFLVIRKLILCSGAAIAILLSVPLQISTLSAQDGVPQISQPSDRQSGEQPQDIRLLWRLENPFRFFKDPHDTDVHREVFEDLHASERSSPVLSAERILNAGSQAGWAAAMFEKTCWDAARNRHRCKKGDYINPKSHAVLATLEGVAEPDAGCAWITSSPLRHRARTKTITGPCGGPMRFEVPYPKGLHVRVEMGGRVVVAETLVVRDVLVAAMGDSFASGEGNPDVPVRFSQKRAQGYGKLEGKFDLSGYPARDGNWKVIGDAKFNAQNARWNDHACHRSLYSHQLRAALQLSLEDPHRAVTFVGLSCSGAQVTFGLFLRYKGNEWVPNPPQLSQISAISVAQCGESRAPEVDLPEAYHMRGIIKELQGGLVLRKCNRKKARKIDLLLVSAGGNDIGFARLVANAVLADQSLLKKLGGWFGQLHEKNQTQTLLSAVDDRLKALNRAFHSILHVPWNESDRIILTAYPPIALLGENLKVCPSGTAGMDVMRAFALSEKRALTSTLLADKLHQIMKKSARAHHWSFADVHRRAFVGRGICAGVNQGPYAQVDDLRLPRKVDGRWLPYNPADYRAYASRQRWFRTPNDAYLTAHFHATGTVLRKALSLNRLSWFQVLLASTYSGAFHPNAEGQAAIADAVVAKARRVLNKYARRRSSRR